MQLDTQTILTAIAALWAVVLGLGTAYAKVQSDRIARERELTDRCDTQMKDVLRPMTETVATMARTLEAQGAILREVAEYVGEQRRAAQMKALMESSRGGTASS